MGAISSESHSFLFCPLCQNKYTSTSLSIHFPNCVEKWKIQQEPSDKSSREFIEFKKKPINLPAAVQELLKKYPSFGKISSQEDMKRFNELSSTIYQTSSLSACQYCNRTFLPDRLGEILNFLINSEVHLRSCGTGAGSRKANIITVGLTQGVSAKTAASTTMKIMESSQTMSSPKVLPPIGEDHSPICPLCNRKYGTKSINIHITQCGQKRGMKQEEINKLIERMEQESNNKNKPITKMNENEKKELITFVEKTMNDVDLLSYDKFMDKRIACSKCNRKFSKDRIEKHESVCKKV